MNNKRTLLAASILLTFMGCSSTSEKNLSEETVAIGEQNQNEVQAPQQYLTRTELEREFQPVFFRFDSSELTYDGQRKVQSMAESIMSSNVKSTILVNGYADPVGTKSYNYLLGQDRAKTVRNHLVELGVEPSQLKVVSYGEATTVDTSLKDHSQLRRVELSFNEPILKTETQKLSYKK
ncbi:MAG: hypothetical protein CME63_15385 [Halobacteriovoraceae bacterium]|nr:hypothetical protein [Halobacteriovoraceae bacterium]MBC99123.1 hypothetical protein [Halobacteriovoraceae bacterium]|tara:strand:- start:190150 stop:190686 length:537 start_codon:yes stop_codon:yes gene_type:complete